VGTTGRSRETEKRCTGTVGPNAGGRLAGQWSTDGSHRAESGVEPTAGTVAGRYRDVSLTI